MLVPFLCYIPRYEHFPPDVPFISIYIHLQLATRKKHIVGKALLLDKHVFCLSGGFSFRIQSGGHSLGALVSATASLIASLPGLAFDITQRCIRHELSIRLSGRT